MKKLIFILGTFGILIALEACSSNEIPEDVLSPRQMVHLLKDFHLAEGMAEQAYGRPDDRIFYHHEMMEGILNSYQVSREDFYSSYEYYVDHPDLLDSVYMDINDILDSMITDFMENQFNREEIPRPTSAQSKVAKNLRKQKSDN